MVPTSPVVGWSNLFNASERFSELYASDIYQSTPPPPPPAPNPLLPH